MPTITSSDGTRLNYVETGDPAARPVVLIAGFTAATTSWAYQVKPLARAGLRVIAFDRRGHGASEKPMHGANMLRHGADLHELLVELGLRDAALVGGSMGASTIWATVSQFGTDGMAGILSIDQTPKIEVHVVKSGEAPGGIGETGTTAGPPALRNAIYAATGVALRRLPIDRKLLAAGKKA